MVFLGGLGGVQSASSQDEVLSGQSLGIALDQGASRSLLSLQEGWIQWMSLFYQDRPEEANRQVDELLASLENLGMRRLPDLALGAVARGVEAARQGNFTRAELAFTAAERLDPGRSETSFGRAILAEEQGSAWNAFTLRNRGVARLFQNASLRSLWRSNLVQLILTAVLLAGAVFIGLLMVQYGEGLFAALGLALGSYLPAGFHHLLSAVLLLWPIVLPSGLAWLLLYWSILIFRYSSATQKAVLLMIWIVAGVSPVLLHHQEKEVELLLAPPVRAIDALVEGRLYGGLFSDLGVLGSLLPASPAVQQVFGDVHRKIGQWERGRDRYGWVLEKEPDNVSALVDVGNYYFRKEDYGRAIQYYQKAVESQVKSAAAHFNLSQAYSESYLFEDHRRALAAARTADDQAVGRWIRQGLVERIVSIDGGLERRNEILRQLEAKFSEGAVGSSSPYRSLLLPLLALGLAVAFVRLGPDSVKAHQATRPDSSWDRWIHVVVPGLSSAEEGRGLLGFTSLLLVALLLQLLVLGQIGYDLPWGLDAGLTLPAVVGFAGLAIYLAFRLWRALRLSRRY
jgi:tetratricopeptide (TPR) repeat protein